MDDFVVGAETLGAMVDGIGDTDRLLAMAAALRAEQIDQARRYADISVRVTTSAGMKPWSQAETARRTLLSELSAALRMPEPTIQKLVTESKALVHDLPATFAALKQGAMSYRHAQVVIDQTWSLPESSWAEFERAVVPYASTLTVSKFKGKARTLRERLEPGSAVERHRRCVDDRSLGLENAPDGMAYLTSYLPAVDAHAIYNRVTDAAMRMQGPSEPRTLTQLRADVARDLMLGGTGAAATIKPWVALTVPVLSLLGMDDEPASVEGYGPIDIETATALCADAPSFVRILTHPETGVVLSVGRDRYSIPADLRTWLRIRDQTCRRPTCNRSAASSDIDHTREWQNGGQTSHDNLTHLCPKDHELKHHTGWKMKQLPGGDIEWTSPTGHTYLSEPGNRMRG